MRKHREIPDANQLFWQRVDIMCASIQNQLQYNENNEASVMGTYYECSRTADAWAKKGWKATSRHVTNEVYETIIWRSPEHMPDERTLAQKIKWTLSAWWYELTERLFPGAID